MNRLAEAILALQEIKEDDTLPKGVRERVTEIMNGLQNDGEHKLKINKALGVLEEISEDSNMESFTRLQLYNIASILESI